MNYSSTGVIMKAITMTSRERVIAAINHKAPDRVPVDLGATRTSGISIFCYNQLKTHLGIDNGLSKVVDVYQMLAWAEPEIVERLHVDVLMVPKLSHRLLTSLSGWSEWELPHGDRVLMPAGFAPETTADGDWLITDADGSRARMPKSGFYFDYLENTIAPRPLDVDRIEFGSWPDEDYRFCGDQAQKLFESTEKALVGDFGVSLGKPASYEDWLMALAAEPGYIKEFNDKKADHIVDLLR